MFANVSWRTVKNVKKVTKKVLTEEVGGGIIYKSLRYSENLEN